MHYEVELGLVIGGGPWKNLPDVSRENESSKDQKHDWMAPIRSYVIGIDMTARNVQDQAKKKGLPWTMAKGALSRPPCLLSPDRLLMTQP